MNTKRSRPEGFSLVEVVTALGIAAFCLIALFGLLPVGVNSNQTSLAQTAAASAAANVVSDLRAAPLVSSTVPNPVSPQFGIPLPTTPGTPPMYSLFLRDDGSWAAAAGTAAAGAPGANADPAQNPRYRATLMFLTPTPALPTTPFQRSPTRVRVLVTWPALADPLAANAPTRFAGSFETVVALDRN